MCAELANLNHCAVPFLSRTAVNLSWYDSTIPHKHLDNISSIFYQLIEFNVFIPFSNSLLSFLTRERFMQLQKSEHRDNYDIVYR